MKCEILYEDRDLLVIRKPAGLATQSASVSQPDAVSELKSYLAKSAASRQASPYLGIVHRLDQPVEGLLVFAKTKGAAADLTRQLSGGILNKRYYALVSGKPAQKSGKITDFLYQDQTNTARVVTGREKEFPQAKWAGLTYEVIGETSLETSPGTQEIVSLLDLSIETGRFHQIRAQLSHAGHPLLGDRKYADEKSLALSEELGIRQTALCAYQLKLCHPASGKQMSWKILPQAEAFSVIKDLPL